MAVAQIWYNMNCKETATKALCCILKLTPVWSAQVARKQSLPIINLVNISVILYNSKVP